MVGGGGRGGEPATANALISDATSADVTAPGTINDAGGVGAIALPYDW
jgi:hypothetical protein